MRSVALAWALTWGCTAPVPAPASCRDGGCAGCCDFADRCRPGDAVSACGSGGETCTACTATEACTDGRCSPVAPMGCGAATCSGCCDDGGTCRGGRSPLECGESGAACAACASGTQCSAGACIAVIQCDLSCGAQCCAGAACAATPCGADAGVCTTCTPGELCSAGACAAGAGSRWRLRVVSATIAPARPNGDPWDDKNDPDTKVCANVGDAGQVCTLEASETFAPAWNATFPMPYDFEQLRQVELAVIDSDFPGQTVIDELGVLDLRPRWSGATQAWTVGGASVSNLRLEVEPAP